MVNTELWPLWAFVLRVRNKTRLSRVLQVAMNCEKRWPTGVTERNKNNNGRACLSRDGNIDFEWQQRRLRSPMQNGDLCWSKIAQLGQTVHVVNYSGVFHATNPSSTWGLHALFLLIRQRCIYIVLGNLYAFTPLCLEADSEIVTQTLTTVYVLRLLPAASCELCLSMFAFRNTFSGRNVCSFCYLFAALFCAFNYCFLCLQVEGARTRPTRWDWRVHGHLVPAAQPHGNCRRATWTSCVRPLQRHEVRIRSLST